MRHHLFTAFLLLFTAPVFAQADPASWTYEVKPAAGADTYEVTFTASIRSPWHMYDLGPYEGGPNATEFTFADTPGVERLGGVMQKSEPNRIFDQIFQMQLGYFEGRAVFAQRVRVTGASPVTWQAAVSYQLCDDQSCLAPTDKEFSIPLPAAKPKVAAPPVVVPVAAEPEPEPEPEPVPTPEIAVPPSPQPQPSAVPAEVANPAPGPKSLWAAMLEAIPWALLALTTPCILPMIPMTVSFFIKGQEKKKKGRIRALAYGLSIVLLYTLPVIVFTLAARWFGGDSVTESIFNWFSTHWLPNLIFFAVFMLFAASFFGAFELRLPSKWINKADAGSDRSGLAGVFFMALTLVLVSFSCTAPMVSNALILAGRGEFWEPVAAILGYSIVFALPFVFFAFFPAILQKIPRSGEWMNSVKVVLGFVEVALGLKFLSVADQTYHWGLLDRDIYLAIWIVTFTLLGFYLLGKIKFKHDSEVKHIGIFRLTLVIAVFSFVVYLIPGLWGAPLKALSGYLPPMHTQDFVIGSGPSAAAPTAAPGSVKYGDILHLPHNLPGFFDYDEGMAYAAKVGKPVFVDITGHGCVNCREMEARVWSDPAVLALLRDEYVIIALYVDDKTRLPEAEWVTDARGRTRKTLGQINADLALTRFGTNAQPYYVLLDNADRQIAPPRAYNLDIPAFVDFLQTGIANYRKQ
jgi:thiol:disulfide interchange protein DsbD